MEPDSKAYILKKGEIDRWLISNIDGWKVTRLYNVGDFVNMKSIQKLTSKYTIWNTWYKTYHSFQFQYNRQTDKVSVFYIFKDKGTKQIEKNLTINEYDIVPLSDHEVYKGFILVNSKEYVNVLGKNNTNYNSNQFSVTIHPKLQHLISDDTHYMYPSKKIVTSSF